MEKELRIIEAILLAAFEPLNEEELLEHLPQGTTLSMVQEWLDELKRFYEPRGIQLSRKGGAWLFHTASDLSPLLEKYRQVPRRLSRPALEILAIIAYHQPVTRAEIEDIRGVSFSSGTLDKLLDMGWVQLMGKRASPGNPTLYGTSDSFLHHFGLDNIQDLPDLEELRDTAMLDKTPPHAQTSLALSKGEEDERDNHDKDEMEERDF